VDAKFQKLFRFHNVIPQAKALSGELYLLRCRDAQHQQTWLEQLQSPAP